MNNRINPNKVMKSKHLIFKTPRPKCEKILVRLIKKVRHSYQKLSADVTTNPEFTKTTRMLCCSASNTENFGKINEILLVVIYTKLNKITANKQSHTTKNKTS